jgi:glycosyltransferase involved in cell wall biosynthesis
MSRPRLCLVGPHLGRHSGWVLSQGEILAERFRGEGWPVIETSTVLNPLLRAADMVFTLWRRRHEIDIAIFSCYSGRAFLYTETIGAFCRFLKIPLVIVMHGGALPDFFAAEPARAKKALARAALLVAPSPFLAGAAAKLGFTAKVIPNVFDLAAFAGLAKKDLDPRRPRLLWMRTFHEVYHPELAIDVLALLRKKGIEASLTMAGQDKGLLESCRQRAANLGVEPHVCFPGFLDLAGKKEAFSSHDLLLNTNRIDNTPVSVLEAAAAGLPIVATAAGGLPDLLESGVAALLTPVGNAAAMAGAIESLLGDEDLRRNLAANGREVAAASSWPAVYGRWLEVFQEALPSTTTNSPLSDGRAASSAVTVDSGPRKTSS